jgi:hypothetical protein
MSKRRHVCVAEQTMQMGTIILESTLKQEHGIKDYA